MTEAWPRSRSFLQRGTHELLDRCLRAQERLRAANGIVRVGLLEAESDQSRNGVAELGVRWRQHRSFTGASVEGRSFAHLVFQFHYDALRRFLSHTADLR